MKHATPLALGLLLALPTTFSAPHLAYAWTQHSQPDAMSNRPTMVIFQVAEGYQNDANPPMLVVGCGEGDLRAVVGFGPDVYLGTGMVPVMVRFSDTTPSTETDPVDETGNEIVWYDERIEGVFNGWLFLHVLDAWSHPSKHPSTVAMRVYPPGADPITVKFNLTGFDAAYAPIGKECNIPINSPPPNGWSAEPND